MEKAILVISRFWLNKGEKMSTIIVGLIVFSITGLVIWKMIKDKRNNISSCGCGCKGCASADICHQK